MSLSEFKEALSHIHDCKPSSRGTLNGHDYVDFGLPSGTLWATSNIELETGSHFAWGETQPKTRFYGGNYKYGRIETEKYGRIFKKEFNVLKITKYCTDDKIVFDDDRRVWRRGIVDNKKKLELSDDAAHAIWGSSWRMPTVEDFKELEEYCNFTRLGGFWAVTNNVDDNNFILLLPTGFYDGDNLYSEDHGMYLTSNLGWDFTRVCVFDIHNTKYDVKVECDSFEKKRHCGYPIRPVSSPIKD